MLFYKIDETIESFTVGKGEVLYRHVIQPHQIHGCSVKEVDRQDMTRDDLEGIDAIISNLVDCPIGVRTADCVPVILFDPIQRAVAAIHSGWRGTVLMIVKKTVNEMTLHYGTQPSNIKAVIGPSIGPDSFKVHNDVVTAFRNAGFPQEMICRQISKEEYSIDLWMANKWILESIGVQPSNIQISGICTFMHHNEFYSARYEHNNKCGRNINVIRIKNSCVV